MRYEKVICTGCDYQLPRTGFGRMTNNPVERIFWGRVPVFYASSTFFFRKGSRIQSVLHEIKYRSNHDAAIYFGELMGRDFISKPVIPAPDLVVPVPLHPKKEKIRGYNQSRILAQGFSNVTGIPVNNNFLRRISETSSQTKKDRWTRIENMKEVFVVVNAEMFEGRHILLLDDVITTGATAEACILSLLTIKNVKVSLISLACA